MQVREDGDRVRLFTRRGFDWTHRYPRAVAGVRRLAVASVTIDAELVAAGPNGVADFPALFPLHRRRSLCVGATFMELEGEDLRPAPLVARIKAPLAKVLQRASDGIHRVWRELKAGK